MNTPVTWAIQTNFIADEQIRRVWNAAEDAGARVQDIQVIPFSDELVSDELGNHVPRIVAAVTRHFAAAPRAAAADEADAPA